MGMIHDVDDAIVRIARGQGAIDLALGETLDLLFAGDRLLKVGPATERDYARERLGLPVRTMRDALELGRACRGRPFLRKAVAAGLVTPCAARAIAPVVGENEPGWTALAMTSTVRELRAAVRAAGKAPPEEARFETLRLRMNPAQQDRLDKALKLADETLGGGATRWQCYEAIAQEWLAEHGGLAPEVEGARGPEAHSEAKPFPECVTDYLAAIEEAEALFKHDHEETTDPKELDARAMRFVANRRGYDLAFGPLAVRVVDEKVWAKAGYGSLEDYCLERLGMAPSGFRQRVWLERQMFALAPLREALKSGRLTYTKALLVAADATPETIADLIEKAADTTWQQTEREATAREDRRNRARGIRRLSGPEDVMETVVAAIRSAQRLARTQGRRIHTGEALAVVADHFLDTWPKHRLKPQSKARAEVLRRNRGLCQVPGCSLGARHVHHLRPRSQGGTDDPWNETQLCIPHHLRGIHMGYLIVEGRGGERLKWHFGNGEVWITDGDDARRTEAAPSAEPPVNPDAGHVSEPAPPAYAAEARSRHSRAFLVLFVRVAAAA